MAVQQYRYNGGVFVQQNWLEHILFEIGDLFDISIITENEAMGMTAILSLAGGLLGGLIAGRVGFAAGAGLGGAAGYAGSKIMTLRELWATFKEKLKDILTIIINHLRKWDAVDFYKAYKSLKNCTKSREKLALAIVEFVIQVLDVEVRSSRLQITSA